MAENVYLKGTVWTEKEDDFLQLHYVQLPQREIAIRLARTKGEVQHRLQFLELKLTEVQRLLKKQAAAYKMVEQRHIFFTDEINQYLRNTYPDVLTIVISKYLGVSVQSVVSQASRLGLKKSETFMQHLKKTIIPKNRYSSRTKNRKKEVSHDDKR